MKKIYAILLIIFILFLAMINAAFMYYQQNSSIGFMFLVIAVLISEFIWNQSKTTIDKAQKNTINQFNTHEKNQTIICKNCKKKNNQGNKFCIYCGTHILVTQKNSTENFNKTEEIQIYNEIIKEYDGILVALLAKVAKVDGQINKDEAKYISKIYDKLSLIRKDIPNIRDIYKKILNNEKTKLDNLKLLCSYLTKGSDESSRTAMLRILIELAHIDNEYSREEENLIVRIVYTLNIDFSIYKQLISEFKENTNSKDSSTFNRNDLTLDECYKILESTKENNNLEIKQNYRRLAKQYHPDMLSSKELPVDMIAFAEEKLKKIHMVYERIQKSRGIK